MARKSNDPFGFMAAINWDRVEELLNDPEVAAVMDGALTPEAQAEEVQYEDCQGYQGGCGSPSCLTCNPDEPCCYNSTRNFGTGDHEVDCPNYR